MTTKKQKQKQKQSKAKRQQQQQQKQRQKATATARATAEGDPPALRKDDNKNATAGSRVETAGRDFQGYGDGKRD
jgi:hypothetical protein